ncbi:hypothetical protein [Thermobifida cellulosilytica]|uniref:Uncharacterized protein n=1 Tax=Thermobifida cellulosilytica TB100 TaxID=665004 RepID=A0A147KGJ6_THECS|nr:hypothetical protein [Thermobifida cellulosilytica]KUP96309.1 hypothetical protein AC529_12795 [Thermobifida cellulosilytica TB100]
MFPLLERGTHAYLSTLLRLAQQEGLLTFHEDRGRDAYRITTRAGRPVTLSPDQVVPFCEGLCAAHTALADEPLDSLARAIDEGVGTVSCTACRAPNPKHALRCRICGQRLLEESSPGGERAAG